jgi:hypothetical protein
MRGGKPNGVLQQKQMGDGKNASSPEVRHNRSD